MANPNLPDESLLEYCTTDQQREKLKAWRANGSARKAAQALGYKDHTSFVKLVASLKKKAGLVGELGHASEDPPELDVSDKIAPGFDLARGYSIQTRTPGGDLIWLKAMPKREKEAFQQFIEELKEQTPRAEPVGKLRAKKLDDSILPAIFIGDSHYGMYAYAMETKHTDFNSEIAQQLMLTAVTDLIDRAPVAETLLLVDVGDYMHANSSHNKTFNGTDVDVDTRLGRVMRIASRAMKMAVDLALKKFAKVVVVKARGNHNPDMAIAVQEIIYAFYEREPRVTVLETNGYFHYIEYGKWLIGVNHGDKVKADRLPGIMARDMSKAWGRTTHRMWALGHFHHQDVKEFDGCYVQKFAALPPPDGWHASMGFSSIQAMQMVVFRKSGGKHSTLIHEIPRPEWEPDVRID